MDITQVIDRKHEIRSLPEPPQNVRQRMAQAAEQISLAGVVAARVEVANEAIYRFAGILYQRDSDGAYPNLDAVTKRIIVAAPWGNVGWKRWGLRHWEARRLRKILLKRQAQFTPKQRPPLFAFDVDGRFWYLNIHDYSTYEAAQHWLTRGSVTVQEWRGL